VDATELTRLSRGRRFVDRYLPALLTQAAHLIVGDFAEVIRSHGLSVLEWRVLATLADADPLPVGLLARRAVTKQPTLTRLLDRMALQGHVERLPAPADRRQTLVCITPVGRELVQGLMQQAEARQHALLGSLGMGRQIALEQLLRHLIESLSAGAAAAEAPTAPASTRRVRPDSLVFRTPG
jgi:DNA-binding MarR family transcriptional regulator